MLIKHCLIEPLFERFNRHLDGHGYQARKGQIIDATIVPVPTQRHTREENATIKAGQVPAGWDKQPNTLRQKDTDARWTRKHGQNHYGYKNHIHIDSKHKLIRNFDVTDASVHDTRVLDGLVDPANTRAAIWADSAYRSEQTEQTLEDNGYRSQIHPKGKRNKPLSEPKQAVNRRRSKVRVRVEPVFGFPHTSMGGKFIRTIGILRASAKIGLMNLGYNLKRYGWLEQRRHTMRASCA